MPLTGTILPKGARHSIVWAFALLGCLLLGAATAYLTSQREIQDVQQRLSITGLGVADNHRACWDERFSYQYWWGSGTWIDAESISVTELDQVGLEVTADPDRPKHWLDDTHWVWASHASDYGAWTPEQWAKLAEVQPARGSHGFWGHFRVGWPQRMFECEWRQALPSADGLVGVDVPLAGATVVGGQLVNDEWIRPTHLLWSGAIFNSLVFAVIWAGGVAALVIFISTGRAGRRLLRAHRGRCPRCGYQLHNNLEDGCPECGWRR